MASYLTHAQMALETYDKLKQGNNFEIEINPKMMTTFSHGIDLSRHNYLTHNKKTQEFLLHFLKKVKIEKQIETPSVVAMLYGHICHYFLDTSIHPYIYYIEKGTQSVLGQFVDGHTLVESFLNAYFIKERLNESILDVRIHRYFTLAPQECRKVLEELYLEVYHLKHVARNYQSTLLLILFCETTLKNTPLNNQKLCETVVSYRRYLKHNLLTTDEIVNEDHKAWQHPVTGKTSNASVLDLYTKSIEEATIAIIESNKYLYGNQNIEALKNYFPNISYDTGVDLEENQEMKYFRKR